MKNPLGMLWFDNDPKHTLLHKIHQAIDYYIKKYGDWGQPDLVLVPELPEDWEEIDGITVRAAPNLLANNIWIGYKDDGKGQADTE